MKLPPIAYLILLVALMGAYTGWRQYERRVGALQVMVQDDVRVAKALRLRADSLERRFRVDTVRVFRSIATIDTLVQHRIDTAIVHQTDTVKITVREAQAIQDTIRACKVLVSDCATLAKTRAEQIDVLRAENDKIRSLTPSTARLWLDRILYAGIGYTLGSLVPKK